jgi:hypothetical protein
MIQMSMTVYQISVLSPDSLEQLSNLSVLQNIAPYLPGNDF